MWPGSDLAVTWPYSLFMAKMASDDLAPNPGYQEQPAASEEQPSKGEAGPGRPGGSAGRGAHTLVNAHDTGGSGAPTDLVVLMSTFPNLEDLGEIAATLVGENLCACVNILRETLSIYRWNDEIVTNKEVLCLIKTSRARQAALVARLTELHPYEVPELITLTPSAVSESYLRWVNEMTQALPDDPAGI